MVEGRNALKIVTNKPKGKRPLGRPTGRWKNYIRMDIKEIDKMRGIWLIRLRRGIIQEYF